MNGTKRYGPQAKGQHFGLQFLVMGGGMLSLLAIKEKPCNSFNRRRQPWKEK
jgi:hypothetical protein